MDLNEARQQVGRQGRSGVLDGDYFPLAGGLNVVDTPLQIAPGELIDGVNYEPRTLGGYQRLQGYERFDGQTLASAASYWIMPVTAVTAANLPTLVGQLIYDTAGRTAYCLQSVITGTSGYLVLLGNSAVNATAAVFGSTSGHAPFVALMTGSIAGPIFAFPTALATQNAYATSNPTLNTTYYVAAREFMRTLILAVPGSGPIRGVINVNGTILAFRNTANGSAKAIYSSGAFGWQLVALGGILNFVSGTLNPGDSRSVYPPPALIGVTSGATMTIARLVLQSGSFAAGTAAGYLVYAASGITGTFNASEPLELTDGPGSGSNFATSSGSQVATTLNPNGTLSQVAQNFYGSTGTICVYGADGVNHGFEMSTSPPFYYCPIYSGMPSDTPSYVESHRGRLWLAFPNGSLQPSSVNDPVVYSALSGAAELGIGYNITGLLGEMSPSQSAFYSTATLFVFTQNEIFTITGDGPNWILGPFAVDSGAAPFSVQRMAQGIILNQRGFATLQSIQQLGNFALASFSQKIQSLVAQINANSACSMVSKNKSLYRLFMTDGRFVSIGFKDLKVTGITLCDLSQAMSCAISGYNAAGAEQLVMGGTNGYVYLMDSGVQIDGAQLNAYLHLAFHFSKSPDRHKRYRRAELDMLANGNATLQFAPDYSYGSPKVGDDQPRTLVTVGTTQSPGYYSNFTWTNGTIAKPTFKLEGAGTNVGMVILHQSTNENPHVLQGVTLTKSMRRLDRGSNA